MSHRTLGPAFRSVLAACTLAGPMFAIPTPAGTGPPEPLEQWTTGLALLHSSRTDEALQWFLARGESRPDDLCGDYFPALVYSYFDVDGMPRQEEIRRGLALLDRGIEAGQKRLELPETDDATRYCLGALYGLRAANRLERSKYLGAAFDARRSRRVMLDLLARRPECVDCKFWVGSYDYFADVLPGMVKFFRSLLFFPKGDRQRGLDALRAVGGSGTLDRYNALWMLYRLNRDIEDEPQQALRTLERIHSVYPRNVDAVIALAGHFAWVATPPERARGITLLLHALEEREPTAAAGAEVPVLRIKDSLARAYMSDLRPEAAVDLLLPLLPSTRGHEERELKLSSALVRALNHSGRNGEALRLLEDLQARYPGSAGLEDLERSARAFDATSSRVFRRSVVAWRIGREGDLQRAESVFADLLRSEPARGVVHFAMAGMYLDLGRRQQAERHYRRALEIGIERPQYLTSLSYLRLGNLLDLRGARGEAKGFYKKAAGTAGSQEPLRSLAKAHLKKPYDGSGGVRYP